MQRIIKAWLIASICLLGSLNTKAEQKAETEFSDAQLAQILAPIALYPDTVLTHILIASTYPIEVVQAERWAQQHDQLDPEDAIDAVEDKDWDPSVKALVPFPNLLKQLSEQLEWTQNIGDAFLQDEARVLDAIQTLRQKAYAAGNLQSNDQIEVERDEQKVIVIEPRETRVVYVPYYDTRVVYGDWHWAHYPPVYWRPWHHHHHHYSHGVYWGPRVRLSVGFFFGSFHWWNRHVVVIDHHHYRRHSFRSSYSRGRHIAQHSTGRHWSHNPKHRRGVAYRTQKVKTRFHSNKPARVEVSKSRHVSHSDRKRHATKVSRSEMNTIKRHENVKNRLREKSNQSRRSNTHVNKTDVNRSKVTRTKVTTTREHKSRDNKTVRTTTTRERTTRESKARESNNRQTKKSTQSRSKKDHSARSNDRREKRASSHSRSRTQSRQQRSNRSSSNRSRNKKD